MQVGRNAQGKGKVLWLFYVLSTTDRGTPKWAILAPGKIPQLPRERKQPFPPDQHEVFGTACRDQGRAPLLGAAERTLDGEHRPKPLRERKGESERLAKRSAINGPFPGATDIYDFFTLFV